MESLRILLSMAVSIGIMNDRWTAHNKIPLIKTAMFHAREFGPLTGDGLEMILSQERAGGRPQ